MFTIYSKIEDFGVRAEEALALGSLATEGMQKYPKDGKIISKVRFWAVRNVKGGLKAFQICKVQKIALTLQCI